MLSGSLASFDRGPSSTVADSLISACGAALANKCSVLGVTGPCKVNNSFSGLNSSTNARKRRYELEDEFC